jgi:CYTH domain-containing protein
MREIERKFEVCDDSWKDFVVSTTKMVQGFLYYKEGKRSRIRIENTNGKISCCLTIKHQLSKHSREEVNIPVSRIEAYSLFSMCDGLFNFKTRHQVQVGSNIWEVDEYDETNLISVEIEVDTPLDFDTLEYPSFVGKLYEGPSNYKLAKATKKMMIEKYGKDFFKKRFIDSIFKVIKDKHFK